MPKILDTILGAIGETPLVRLNRIGSDTGCEILAKCEFLNAGGSVKDRIGRRMIEEAERSGRIKPGDTLIEPTSGNTGIGLALAAAIKGYRMIITMPQKMSREKQVVLEALGAEIIRTPTEAAFDAPDSHISVAQQLERILPNAHVLDQYANPDNPLAHYHGTAEEILRQTDGALDALVLTAGTGGTVAGTARRLKEALPDLEVVGVDPEGSILAGPGPIGSYHVEGIGYDFIPDVLDRDLVDTWIKSNDRDSFQMARRLIRQEGLLVGGSSGSAVCAAVEVAKRLGSGKRVVTLLPDSVRNYMTKFVDDRWMREQGFHAQPWAAQTLADLVRAMPPRELVVGGSADQVETAIRRMKEHGISQLPIVDEGRLVGIVTEADLLARLVDDHATLKTSVAEVMLRDVRTVSSGDDAGVLTELFADGMVALVVDDERRLQALLSKIDLVDYLTQRPGGA